MLEGRRVAAVGDATAPAAECTYTVLEPSAAPKGDKRDRPRQRTRLRTGKIVDAAGRFLTECLIHDRSNEGGRLRVPAGVALPLTIQLFEDQGASLHQADIVWRDERDVGIRIRPATPTARSRALEADLRRRFYAVRG